MSGAAGGNALGGGGGGGGGGRGGAEHAEAPVELLRVHPELLDVVAQLVWVAAPSTELLRDDAHDASGLVVLHARAPLSEAQAAAFERGLDALLREPSEQRRGTYLREVHDLRGRRRELGVPIPPSAWDERAGLVGPFADEAEAHAWQARTLPPGWLGDPLPHQGRWFSDVFQADDEGVRRIPS